MNGIVPAVEVLILGLQLYLSNCTCPELYEGYGTIFLEKTIENLPNDYFSINIFELLHGLQLESLLYN